MDFTIYSTIVCGIKEYGRIRSPRETAMPQFYLITEFLRHKT